MRTVVIYPGRFHPFHRGHKASYDYLTKRYGDRNVFVVSSDKQDPETSPFSFADKMDMMTKLGISPGQIAQVRNPYQAKEIKDEIDDPENTILIFAVSEKDMSGEDARFTFGAKKDGSPSYMQPLPADGKGMQPMTKHAYVAVTPTVNFRVRGADANSASQIRKQYIAGNDADREQIIADLYGDVDPGIRDIFDRKLGTGTPVQTVTYGQEQIYAGDKHLGESLELKEGIAGTLLALFADLLRQLKLITPEQFDQWKKDQAENVKQEMIGLLRDHPNRDAIAPLVHKMTARLNDAKNALQFARALRLMAEFFNRAIELREFAPGGADIVPPPPKAKGKDPFEPDDRSQVLMSIKRLLDSGNKIDSMLVGARGHITHVAPDLAGFGAKKLNKPHARGGLFRPMDEDDDEQVFLKLIKPGYYQLWDKELAEDYIEEKWSQKYKSSINCSNPQGFSQRAHCQGRKK